AWKYWREGVSSNPIDPALKVESSSIRNIKRCIHIGLLCVQENAVYRPIMASVVLMLNRFSITLSLPSKPAFFVHNRIDPDLPLLLEFSSGAKESGQSTIITGGSGNKTQTILAIAIHTTSAVLIVVFICLLLSMRKRKQNINVERLLLFREAIDEISSVVSSYFDLGSIRVATDYLSDTNKFGQGGFSVVYKYLLGNIGAKEQVKVESIQHRELIQAWKYWREGAGSNLIDHALRADSSLIRDIVRCIHIGLLCVQENVASRPVMASVVLMVNSFSITLPLPSEPAFFMHSSIDPELPLLHEFSSGIKDSSQSTSKSAYFSGNEASISDLHPR
ncbi:hypothetical protein RJ639_045042, partial [Escallonia herrerae]